MAPAHKDQKENKSKYSPVVPAVEQASRILLCLAQDRAGKRTLTEICNQLGIHKSRGFSILHTLKQFGFIDRDPQSKVYSLGTGLLFLSSRVLANLDLREISGPFLRRLSWETNNTALFGAISDRHVFIVAREEGGQEIGVTIRLGHRFPLTWGAHGKAIVTCLPKKERESVLAGEKLYFHGQPSRFDKGRIEKEMARYRETGFALDMGELTPGIHAVASAVLGTAGTPVGCIIVVGTFPEELAKEYGFKVAKAAREFSKVLGAGDTALP